MIGEYRHSWELPSFLSTWRLSNSEKQIISINPALMWWHITQQEDLGQLPFFKQIPPQTIKGRLRVKHRASTPPVLLKGPSHWLILPATYALVGTVDYVVSSYWLPHFPEVLNVRTYPRKGLSHHDSNWDEHSLSIKVPKGWWLVGVWNTRICLANILA